MNRVHTDSEYRMAQNASKYRNRLTCGHLAGPKVLLCAQAPGVYFVRGPKTEDGRPGAAVHKVVIGQQ